MMATAFMGYVLPWGQMSFWGADVITTLFSAIPVVGDSITTWLWGGYSVGNADAEPLLLAALPAALHDRRRRGAAHLGAARAGPEQPGRRRGRSRRRTRCPSPLLHGQGRLRVVCFLIFFAWFVFFIPNYLGHADNYIEANPLVTPAHIVPEWYFLPFYAILRVDPEQARRRLRAVRLDRAPGLPALARHVAGPLGAATAPSTSMFFWVFVGAPASASAGSARSRRKAATWSLSRLLHRLLLRPTS